MFNEIMSELQFPSRSTTNSQRWFYRWRRGFYSISRVHLRVRGSISFNCLRQPCPLSSPTNLTISSKSSYSGSETNPHPPQRHSTASALWSLATSAPRSWMAPRQVLPCPAGYVCRLVNTEQILCFLENKRTVRRGLWLVQQHVQQSAMYGLVRARMMHHAGLFSHRRPGRPFCLCVGGNTTYTYVFRDAAAAASGFFPPKWIRRRSTNSSGSRSPPATNDVDDVAFLYNQENCITPWWVPPGWSCCSCSSTSLQRTPWTTENIPS